jgi:hypothetical protein
MSPETGRFGFRLGFTILVPAILLLLVLPRGSAEFFVTIFTALVALGFLLMITVLIRLAS